MQIDPRARLFRALSPPLLLLAMLGPPALGSTAEDCVAGWSASHLRLPGTSGGVRALAVFDDGTGPALYAGGEFEIAGGRRASRIARWNGQDWSPLAGDLDSSVTALCVFDEGSGPALYVGGTFTQIDGVPFAHLARWDGASWSDVGGGVGGGTFQGTRVACLRVFDEGIGPALYVGGDFTAAGGTSVHHLARWDGASWSAMGPGLSAHVGPIPVAALEVFDDGNGARLYAAGSLALGNVLRWSGAAWEPLGRGIGGTVSTLTVYDDGSGPQLVAGGHFMAAGGQEMRRVARWNGASWSTLGNGIGLGVPDQTHVASLLAFDSGSGPELYATGSFQQGAPFLYGIARWTGSAWVPLGEGLSNSSFNDGRGSCLSLYDEGSGPALFVGGTFQRSGAVGMPNIGRWDGAAWSQVGSGFSGPATPEVRAAAEFDDGSGPALYVGGSFLGLAGVASPAIVRSQGGTWSSVGSGLRHANGTPQVSDLEVFDSGTGAALFAAGSFTSSAGVSLQGLARWDGSAWSALAGGTLLAPGTSGLIVRSLKAHDDGLGPALFAAGNFSSPVQGIGRWNGATWWSLGGVFGDVQTLAVHDDGSGPALYAAGGFTHIGGVAAAGIARWDGGAWSPVGAGITSSGGRIFALAVHDAGNGPQLHAGGSFAEMGGQAAANVARWDGLQWHPLGSGVFGAVHALGSFDEGSGALLYVGGSFSLAGGHPAHGLARWDGTAWTIPAGELGVQAPSGILPGSVLMLHGREPDSGPELWVGGGFQLSPTGDGALTRFTGCGPPPAPYCFGDGSGVPCPCGNTGPVGHGCRNSLALGAVLSATGSAGTGADDLTLGGSRLPLAAPCLLVVGSTAVQGGAGVAFGDGLRCVGGAVTRLGVKLSGPTGAVVYGPGLGGIGGWQAGDVRRFQIGYRDPLGPCGTGFNFSNGIEIVFR